MIFPSFDEKTEKPLRRATVLCERPQTTDSMVATVKQAGEEPQSLMREQAGEELQSSMREEQVQDPTSVVQSSCLDCDSAVETAGSTLCSSVMPNALSPSRDEQLQMLPPSIITAPRHVHFAIDEKGRLEKQIFEYEPMPESCRPDLYFSEEEVHAIQQRSRNEARAYIKSNKRYRQFLKSYLDNKEADKEETVVDLIFEASDIRGLENCVTKMLKAQRKLVILSVLDLQQKMKRMGCSQTKLQRQTMLEIGLRAKSSQASQAFRSLALCMAEADAKAVE